MNKEDIPYKCGNCNNTKIQTKEWVEINSGKIVNTAVLDDSDHWCPDCETHCKIIDNI